MKIAAVVVAVAVMACPALAAERKPPPCPPGNYQFVAKGEPVLNQDGKTERIVIKDHMVSIGDTCPPVASTVQAGPGGISVRARWDSCAGIVGPVELDGFIHPVACIRLTGTLKSGKAAAREFTAMMPQCDADPPSDEELNAATDYAFGQVDNPWGNADDFFRMFLLTQAKLGCALADKDLQPPRHGRRRAD